MKTTTKKVNRNTVYKKASIKIKWQNAPKYNDMLDSISTFLSQCIYMPLLHVLKWVSCRLFILFFCLFLLSPDHSCQTAGNPLWFLGNHLPFSLNKRVLLYKSSSDEYFCDLNK